MPLILFADSYQKLFNDAVTAYRHDPKSYDAALVIAKLYASGKGVAKNSKKALLWYRRSANAGSQKACEYLMRDYHKKKQITKALYWAEKGSHLGSDRASVYAGLLWDSLGERLKAKEAYKMGTSFAGKYSAYRLAKWYEAKQMIPKARYWYRKSLAWGYKKARGALKDQSQ